MSVSKEVSKIKKVLDDFSEERSSMIPILQNVQEEVGYLPKHAFGTISQHLKVPEAEIYGIATFYSQFRFTPVGRHKVTVCQGTACHVRGGALILSEVESAIGIKSGETSRDLEFTLETVGCIGSCALAPVAIADKKVYGVLTPESANQMVEDIKAS